MCWSLYLISIFSFPLENKAFLEESTFKDLQAEVYDITVASETCMHHVKRHDGQILTDRQSCSSQAFQALGSSRKRRRSIDDEHLTSKRICSRPEDIVVGNIQYTPLSRQDEGQKIESYNAYSLMLPDLPQTSLNCKLYWYFFCSIAERLQSIGYHRLLKYRYVSLLKMYFSILTHDLGDTGLPFTYAELFDFPTMPTFASDIVDISPPSLESFSSSSELFFLYPELESFCSGNKTETEQSSKWQGYK